MQIVLLVKSIKVIYCTSVCWWHHTYVLVVDQPLKLLLVLWTYNLNPLIIGPLTVKWNWTIWSQQLCGSGYQRVARDLALTIIMLGGIALKAAVTKQKYIGLNFDQNLSWDHHVSLLCKRMSYYLYVIHCHRNALGFKLLKLLIESLVLAHLNYCLLIRGVLLHTQSLQKLKRMQNKAVPLYRNCVSMTMFQSTTIQLEAAINTVLFPMLIAP